jgi:hypothetical protein
MDRLDNPAHDGVEGMRLFRGVAWSTRRGKQPVSRHLLVFDDGNGDEIDLRGFVETLDDGAEVFTLDEHVCFVKSVLPAGEISDRFSKFAGSRLFFVTDVTSSPCAGRMPGSFWDDIKGSALRTAAE